MKTRKLTVGRIEKVALLILAGLFVLCKSALAVDFDVEQVEINVVNPLDPMILQSPAFEGMSTGAFDFASGDVEFNSSDFSKQTLEPYQEIIYTVRGEPTAERPDGIAIVLAGEEVAELVAQLVNREGANEAVAMVVRDESVAFLSGEETETPDHLETLRASEAPIPPAALKL